MLTLAMLLIFSSVVLLMIEVLIIPGFGVFGITGIMGLVTGIGIMMSAPGITGAMALVTVSLIVILTAIVATLVIRDKRPKMLILKERLSGIAAEDLENLTGISGLTLTPLRPSGMAQLDGRRINVISQGEFLPKNTSITVVFVQGQRVVVKKEQ